MKIELRKETKVDGSVFYWVYADGQIVPNTCTMNEETANEMFKFILKNGIGPKVEIIRSHETDDK